MGLIAPSTGSLNGNRVIESRSTFPAWGASYHDVTVDGQVTLTGPVTLKIADLTVACTVLSGGPSPNAGRSFYRLVAGAGGWGRMIPAKSYSNDAGVKLATVLGDAAAAVGETIGGTVDPSIRVGPYYVRPADQACRVLELESPNAWYVGEDGLTRLGARTPGTVPSLTVVEQVDLARGTAVVASASIANLLPGVTIQGLTAVDIEHELSAGGSLRTRVWGKRAGGMSRRLAALRAIFGQLFPERKFLGSYEFRIGNQNGNRLDLQPVRAVDGLPTVLRVAVRPGIPGAKASYTLGSRVVVTFLGADPSRPIVLGFEDADGPGWAVTSLQLGTAPGALALATPTLAVFTAINAWTTDLQSALANVANMTPQQVASQLAPATGTLTTALTSTAPTAVPTKEFSAT